jgi:hypothetical protein
MNVELFYQTLFRIIEEKEGVKIKYKIERRKETDGIQMCRCKS